MNYKLILNELIIVIGAKGLKPYIFNSEFLQQSEIVPEDWELAQKPLHSKQGVQSQFKNNVMFTAQHNRIVITELIKDKSCEEILAPDLARKFINKLPKIDYRALVINPKGYVSFNNDSQAINNYIYQNLFTPASWQEFGTAPVQSAINFKFTLEQGNLYLKIAQASINNCDRGKESIIMFSGNFEHGLSKESCQERTLQLQQYLAAWHKDVATYQNLIENKFINLATKSSQDLVTAI